MDFVACSRINSATTNLSRTDPRFKQVTPLMVWTNEQYALLQMKANKVLLKSDYGTGTVGLIS